MAWGNASPTQHAPPAKGGAWQLLAQRRRLPSPIQTFTVGSGFTPDPPSETTGFAGLVRLDLTADREFRPAPKV